MAAIGDVPYSNLPNGVILPRILSGYRLPKPEDCCSEIFKVMESCWIEAPESRPNFRELKKIFDNMISQGIEDDYTAIISTPLNANRI
jgi:hypothetical protein